MTLPCQPIARVLGTLHDSERGVKHTPSWDQGSTLTSSATKQSKYTKTKSIALYENKKKRFLSFNM